METATTKKNTTPARKFEAVGRILEKFNHDREKLIPILQAIQDEYRYLPQEVMVFVASALRISPARLFGVATFYAHFALKPKGKYVIRICDGTACHVKGSMDLLDTLSRELGLRDGATTTPDLLFTIETVSCLGACGLAPAMVINDEVYGQLTPQKARSVLDQIRMKEAEA
jgi:NADH-quinone oxidoreductase subunit E